MKLALALLLAFAAPFVARADEEDEPAPASAGPEAAAAARDKGYRAEEAAPAGITDGGAPAAPQGDPRVIRLPAQRALGGGGSGGAKTAGPGSGGAAAARGVSCEASVPKLKTVHRRDLDFYDKLHRGNVIFWSMGPNEAVSWKFKSPSKGSAAFHTEMATQARPVSHLVTLSETPCDFDVEKAKITSKGGPASAATLCYSWNPVAGGVVFSVDGKGGAAAGCRIKPDTTYYLNIRFLSSPGQGEPRDSCEAEMPFFKKTGIKPLCGGIWQANGNVSWKDEEKVRKAVDFKVNDSAGVGPRP